MKAIAIRKYIITIMFMSNFTAINILLITLTYEVQNSRLLLSFLDALLVFYPKGVGDSSSNLFSLFFKIYSYYRVLITFYCLSDVPFLTALL